MIFKFAAALLSSLFGNVLFDPEMPMLTSFIELQPTATNINCNRQLSVFVWAGYWRIIATVLVKRRTLGLDLTVVLAL